MSVYFTTDSMVDFSSTALCYFDVESTDDFVTYVIDMSKCKAYTGTVTMLRLDLNDNDGGEGTVYIKSIEFAKDAEVDTDKDNSSDNE